MDMVCFKTKYLYLKKLYDIYFSCIYYVLCTMLEVISILD